MSTFNDALVAAAEALEQSADELTRLDALQGDGDLGRTAGLVAAALRSSATHHAGDVAATLRLTGTSIAASAASSSGTLIASGFLAAARAVPEHSEPSLANLLQAAVDGIRRRGKAEPGDRTMLDAMAPAVAALEAQPEDFEAAAQAAEAGADATRHMEAKVGRARFLAANAVGAPDPGAMMVAVGLGAALRAGVRRV